MKLRLIVQSRVVSHETLHINNKNGPRKFICIGFVYGGTLISFVIKENEAINGGHGRGLSEGS